MATKSLYKDYQVAFVVHLVLMVDVLFINHIRFLQNQFAFRYPFLKAQQKYQRVIQTNMHFKQVILLINHDRFVFHKINVKGKVVKREKILILMISLNFVYLEEFNTHQTKLSFHYFTIFLLWQVNANKCYFRFFQLNQVIILISYSLKFKSAGDLFQLTALRQLLQIKFTMAAVSQMIELVNYHD